MVRGADLLGQQTPGDRFAVLVFPVFGAVGLDLTEEGVGLLEQWFQTQRLQSGLFGFGRAVEIGQRGSQVEPAHGVGRLGGDGLFEPGDGAIRRFLAGVLEPGFESHVAVAVAFSDCSIEQSETFAEAS